LVGAYRILRLEFSFPGRFCVEDFPGKENWQQMFFICFAWQEENYFIEKS